jgi:hypothetical protein
MHSPCLRALTNQLHDPLASPPQPGIQSESVDVNVGGAGEEHEDWHADDDADAGALVISSSRQSVRRRDSFQVGSDYERVLFPLLFCSCA